MRVRSKQARSLSLSLSYRQWARNLLPQARDALVDDLAVRLAEEGQRTVGIDGCVDQFRKWLTAGRAKERVLVCGLSGRWSTPVIEALQRQFRAMPLRPEDVLHEAALHASIDAALCQR